jgi:hypothetical protein
MNKMCQFSRFFFATNCTSDTLIFSLQEALEFVSEMPLRCITNCVTKHQT